MAIVMLPNRVILPRSGHPPFARCSERPNKHNPHRRQQTPFTPNQTAKLTLESRKIGQSYFAALQTCLFPIAPGSAAVRPAFWGVSRETPFEKRAGKRAGHAIFAIPGGARGVFHVKQF
jgi:hypothetical protein